MDRAQDCNGTSYARDASGFLEFVEDIGPYPQGMTWPTVGRKDHSLGYVPGNFAWQEMADNSRENIVRIGVGSPGAGTGRTLPETTKEAMRRNHTKEWSEKRRKASRFSGLEPELVSDLMSRVAQQQPYSRAKRL